MEKIKLTKQEKRLLNLLNKENGYMGTMHPDCNGGYFY